MLAMLKVGHKKFWVSFNTGAFSHTEGGRNKIYPVLRVGGCGRNKFWTKDFPIL